MPKLFTFINGMQPALIAVFHLHAASLLSPLAGKADSESRPSLGTFNLNRAS